MDFGIGILTCLNRAELLCYNIIFIIIIFGIDYSEEVRRRGSAKPSPTQKFKQLDMDLVPEVDIAPDGTFHYVLIRVYGKRDPKGYKPSKVVIRGFRDLSHEDICNKECDLFRTLNYGYNCIGGGRMSIHTNQRKIFLYDYPQKFGKPDIDMVIEVLRTIYEEDFYTIKYCSVDDY